MLRSRRQVLGARQKPLLALGTVVLLSAAMTLAGCGGSSTASGDSCGDLGDQVEEYDVLAPGNSREGYLVVLHTLQRDCPSEAEQRGLDISILPRCERLDEENCTMYRGAA